MQTISHDVFLIRSHRMSVDAGSLAQICTIIIACCSVIGLIMGIHMCQLSKNIKHMNLCGRCFTITQFSREGSTEVDRHSEIPVASRFSAHN